MDKVVIDKDDLKRLRCQIEVSKYQIDAMKQFGEDPYGMFKEEIAREIGFKMLEEGLIKFTIQDNVRRETSTISTDIYVYDKKSEE